MRTRPALPESQHAPPRRVALLVCVVVALVVAGALVPIGGPSGLRRHPTAELEALAARLSDPAQRAGPSSGGLAAPGGVSGPIGWSCQDRCEYTCPGDPGSSPAEVDVGRSRVRLDRLVVNDYFPPLTAADMDRILAGTLVAESVECMG